MNGRLRHLVVAASILGVFGCSTADSPGTALDGGGDTGSAGACVALLAANKKLALDVSTKVFLANAPADGTLASTFVAHFPSGQPDQNLQGFLGFGTEFRAALPDAAFTFTHVIAEGKLVALRYLGTGTHKGPLFGVPATGKSLKWEGMVVRRIENGRVAEEWNEPDNAGLMGQLAGGKPALSPAVGDFQGAGDCSTEVVAANKTVALRVSKEVVLGGTAPDSLVSPGFVMHSPNGLEDANLAGFLGFNAGFRAAFPDASFTFTHEVGEGGLVFLRYTATGTHKAEFFGVPATGKKVAWEGAVIRRVDGGKAAEEWNAPDIAGLLSQLTAK